MPDERRYKCQPDEFQSHSSRGVESTSVGRYKELSQAMIGGELRKTRSPHDHKHGTNILHSSVPKSLCNSYESGAHPKVRSFDVLSCDQTQVLQLLGLSNT